MTRGLFRLVGSSSKSDKSTPLDRYEEKDAGAGQVAGSPVRARRWRRMG